MISQKDKVIILTTAADVFTGMATAWILAFLASLTQFVWQDLLNSAILAILSLTTAIGIKVRINYDKFA